MNTKITLKAKDKTISTAPITHLLNQGEHKADTIFLQLPVSYKGLDISDCVFIMRGVSESGNTAEQILPKTLANTRLILQWDVENTFTAEAGKLELELRGVFISNDGMGGNEPLETLVIKYVLEPVYVHGTKKGIAPASTDIIEQALNSFYITMNNALADLDYPYIIMGQLEYNLLEPEEIKHNKLYVIVDN
jgi:hypothetical protein